MKEREPLADILGLGSRSLFVIIYYAAFPNS